jgi:hypothetical protein
VTDIIGHALQHTSARMCTGTMVKISFLLNAWYGYGSLPSVSAEMTSLLFCNCFFCFYFFFYSSAISTGKNTFSTDFMIEMKSVRLTLPRAY